MNSYARAALLAGFILAAPAVAKEKPQRGPVAMEGQLIVYQMPGFNGDYYEIEQDRTTFQTEWPIRSIAIRAGDKWEICARPRFRDCVELNQSLPDASAIGVQDQIGSVRLVKAK
jgi:hypothetical protein